eukprot:1056426_1
MLIQTILIRAVQIQVIACILISIKLWKVSKKAKERCDILGGDVAVSPSTNDKQKEKEESFEVIGDDAIRIQGDDNEEEESQKKENQFGEGKSIPHEPILSREFATNLHQKEDSFEIIGDNDTIDTPMDNDEDIFDGIATVHGNESVEDEEEIVKAVNETPMGNNAGDIMEA